MARTFTKVPQDAFENLQLDAGVLLTEFTPAANPTLTDANILGATTGGISVNCTPEYEDFAEDVDNAPTNLKEFKNLTSWSCTFSTTLLNLSTDGAKKILGAADIDGTDTHKVTPRRELKTADFFDLWWVGDKADGGYVAVKLINALSTGGFSLQTSKNAKGQISVEFTGHVSLANQDVMPMEFYIYDGT